MSRGCALALAGLLCAGCDTSSAHVFVARYLEPDAGCLDPYAAIDVIDGTGSGSGCAPRCLAGTQSVFVSTDCPPFPIGYDVSDEAQTSPTCQAALAALRCNVTCGRDAATCAVQDGGADAADAGRE